MSNADVRHHLFIAGTGRAGTSFLVRYLQAVGLETHISKSGDSQWAESANAGLEDMPVAQPNETLPYVIKSPWIAEFIEQLLENKGIAVDAFIIPVRDLREAAESRIILELCSFYENVDWASSFDSMWRERGFTSGGGVFSLDPVDQERLLAVGFARLVQRLVRANIPIVFLDFPRIVEDPDYLYEQVRSFIPKSVDREAARKCHLLLADPDKVRVANEQIVLAQTVPDGASAPLNPDVGARSACDQRDAAFERLDLIALRREIAKRKKDLRDFKDMASARRRIDEIEALNAGLAGERDGLARERNALQQEVARLRAKEERRLSRVIKRFFKRFTS